VSAVDQTQFDQDGLLFITKKQDIISTRDTCVPLSSISAHNTDTYSELTNCATALELYNRLMVIDNVG